MYSDEARLADLERACGCFEEDSPEKEDEMETRSEDRKFFEAKIQEQIDKQRTHYAEKRYEFKERTAERHNLGDWVGAVLAITNEEDAGRFYRGAVEYMEWLFEQPWADVSYTHTPRQVIQSNIGWCYGEGMDSARIAMWRKVSQAEHPVLVIT